MCARGRCIFAWRLEDAFSVLREAGFLLYEGH